MNIHTERQRSFFPHLFMLLGILIASPVIGEAATYYVGMNGSNSNSCTSARSQTSPKLTIAAGIACMTGGDTLTIGDGTYAEAIRNIIPSGSAGAPTVVRAANNKQVILKPNEPGKWYVLEITQSRSYITIDGIVFDAQNVYCNPVYVSVPAPGTAHHIILKNGDSRNATDDGSHTGMAGIQIGGHENVAGHYSNEVLNWDSYNNPSYGLYISGHDNIVNGNRLFDNAGFGLVIYTTSQIGVNNNVVTSNKIFGNSATHANSKGGVLLSSGSGNVFYNNLVYNNTYNGIQLSNGADSTNVYNNTIYGNTGECVSAQGSGLLVKNNICWANSTNRIVGEATQTNNLCTTQCAVSSDPRFVNAAAGDFRLSAGSPAVDAGTFLGDVTTDSLGLLRLGTPDLGAFEYGAGQTSTPPPAPPTSLPPPPTSLRIVGSN